MESRNITRARRVLVGGRWFLIIGLVFYSLMTTTPFVAAHSEWAWSGWVLGLIVDAAFIMALSAESTLATYGVTKLGAWPAAFRWFTGLCSVFLNVWVSVAAHDWVGVAVHIIAPALVMLLAEVGPVYMAALVDAEAVQRAPWEDAGPVITFSTADETHEHSPDVYTDPGKVMALPDPVDVAQDFAKPDDESMTTQRLSKAQAAEIIESGWRHKLPTAEVADAATRHPATVAAHYRRLDAEHAQSAA